MRKRRQPIAKSCLRQAVPYSLTITLPAGRVQTPELQLASPALDPLLHPSQQVKVELHTAHNRDLVLTSLQLNSLHAYLALQSRIRKALEAKLPPDQENWDPEGESIRGDVWPWLRIVSLDLTANPGNAGTTTSFTISMDCDWDQEHLIRAEFRNGTLVQLDHS